MRSRNSLVFSLVMMILNLACFAASSSAAAEVIAQGSFSENSNSERAPLSNSDAIGNIKKLNVLQSSDGTLKVTIDFWKLPSSNHTVRIRWCTPEKFDDYDGVGICDSTDKDWLNNLVFYSPAKTSKGIQLGFRKSFASTSKKGAKINQWIYTIKGASLAAKPMGLVEVLMLYSSSRFTEVTTTCRGGYSITCNTRSSNVFEGDEADVKLTSTSKATSSNQAYSRQFLAIQDYFDKITGTFSPSTRLFKLACNSNARTDGIIEGLRLFMAISSSTPGVNAGQEWFPKQLTPLYASIAKTWVKDGAPYIMYIEIPFISPDDNRNPCGLNAAGIPKLSAIGNDVESTIFLLAGPNGFAIASPSYSKSVIG